MTQPVQPAAETDADRRRKRYFDEYSDRIDRHREGAAFYEERAIEFANSALKVLMYLNGGGLLAIPATMALFREDARQVEVYLIGAAAAFACGLICITLSQAGAFFVMARRAESEVLLQYEQMEMLRAVHYPAPTPQEQLEITDNAQKHRQTSNAKLRTSDKIRFAALISMWCSLVAFIVGCALGGLSVLFSH
jgi:hypothetical protein